MEIANRHKRSNAQNISLRIFKTFYFTIAAEATRMTTVGQISVLAEIRNALKAEKQHVLKVRETPSTSTSTSTRECQSEGRENGNTQRKTNG